MAIGVRISSENLMGQTVNVTFYPFTGGTAIDLGLKTIPFNYYTTLPYGEYVLSSSTFDVSYNLTVTEPEGQNQSVVYWGTTGTTMALGVLNFNDFTASLITYDNIDMTYWNENSFYISFELGYMLILQNYPEWLVLFVDEAGNLVDQYSASTTNYDYNFIDGKIAYFIDNQNGVMKYFNGTNVYEFTFDQNNEQVEVLWDYYGITLDGSFSIVVINSGSTTNTIYIVKNNGSVLTLLTYDSSLYNNYVGAFYSSNYFYMLTKLELDNSYISFKIYDSNANQVSNNTFTQGVYNNYDVSIYGLSSCQLMLYNNGDNSIDYVLLNFNGETETTITTSHQRGTNYQNYAIEYQDTLWFGSSEGGSIVNLFYGNTDGYYNGAGFSIDYLDIVYLLKDDTNYTGYLYTDSGDFSKYFYLYGDCFLEFNTFCSVGDGLSSIFSITPSGASFTPTNINFEDLTGQDWRTFGNRFAMVFYNNTNNTAYQYFIQNGGLISSLTLNTNGPYYYFVSGSYTFYTTDGTTGWYLNSTTDTIQETDTFSQYRYTYKYYNNQVYITNGTILLFTPETMTCKILNPTSLTNNFSLPPFNNYWDLSLGRNRFLYTYNDLSDNTRVNLYDHNGAMINSTLIPITDWYDSIGYKDRYYVVHNSGVDQRLLTLISDNTVQQVTINTNLVSWYGINDLYWD